MISALKLKYYSSLLKKKFRQKEKKFIAEGERLVTEGVNSSYSIEAAFVTNDYINENRNFEKLITRKNIPLFILSKNNFLKISDTKTPQGIAAVFKFIKQSEFSHALRKENLVVYLDDISDPGNVGTIMRNCDWFGVNDILLSPGTAEFTNPKVVRSSMGSVFHLNIFEEVAVEELFKLKKSGYQICCSDLKGENIFKFKPGNKTVIVFSNEANGLSDDVKNIADFALTVPRKGKAESLNVASASAIILAELTK